MSIPMYADFPHSWKAKMLNGPPLIAPSRQFTYPMFVPGEEDALQRGALFVEINPAVGGTFLATAAAGFRDPSMPSAVYACPNPKDILLVSGGYAYLVDTSQPARCVQLPLRPATTILAAQEHHVILLAGHCEVIAVDENGLRWCSERLSWEGVQLGRIEQGVVHGTGWNMPSDRDVPFTIDLVTGKHEGGGFSPARPK